MAVKKHYFNDGDIRREARVLNYDEPESPTEWEPDIYSASDYFKIFVSADSSFRRAEKMLANIPDGLEKAVRSAAKRVESYLKYASAKEIRDRYAIYHKTVRDEETAKVSYSFENGLELNVRFSGYKIPLYRFMGSAPKVPTKDTSRRFPVAIDATYPLGVRKLKWRSLYPSVAAQGHVLKSTAPYRFERAFVAKMSNGHIGIWERTGLTTKRDKAEIEELYGPSVPQMLGNDEVANRVMDDAHKKFDERLDHEIIRLLNGW